MHRKAKLFDAIEDTDPYNIREHLFRQSTALLDRNHIGRSNSYPALSLPVRVQSICYTD